MPHFEPFRGLRYSSTIRLSDVVAPPYDVISEIQRRTLAQRSPIQSVLLELPESDVGLNLNKYQVAAGLIERWVANGTLISDPKPGFYAYRMTAPDGRSSTGVIGALAVDAPNDMTGDILPHEMTLPKPRGDRLDLLRATRTNLSPIWGLSLSKGLSSLIGASGPPAGDAFDDDGVCHQMWIMDDEEATTAIRESVASAPMVIADGHHRYETARAFREEIRAGNRDQPGSHDLIMTFVVELAENQLSVDPIHRSLRGLPEGFDLVAAFSRWFDVEHVGPASPHVVADLGTSRTLSLLTPSDAWRLTPHADSFVEAGSKLDSSVVSLVLRGLPDHIHTYEHSWQEAFAALESGGAQAAVLLRPVTVSQIAQWAADRRQMPPKTTYFTPKPRTGLVFRRLSDD